MKLLKSPKLDFFDSGFPSSSMSLMTGSNVYDLGGYSGNLTRGNELEAVSADCIYYGQLIATVQRLSTYRNNDLVKTILGLYNDAVSSCINYNAKKIVEVLDKDGRVIQDLTDEVNHAFAEIKYLKLVQSDLDDAIYYGSVCHKLKYENQKFYTDDFKYPFTTGWYKSEDKNVVMSDDGPIFVPDIIRIGADDIRLILDDDLLVKLELMTKEELADYHKDKKRIYSLPKIVCSEPLLLAEELKIKDYVLKDLIASFLSIMDLIQQDTFTIDGQRITDSTNLIKLCQRVKGLLVTKDDMNLLASARLDKTALIRRLFDRVRVIPSIAGALQGLQKLEGTNLREKLDSITGQKETTRDELLTAIGFPKDIYNGGTTKWEASRQNDRYGIKITTIKNSVVNCTLDNARLIIKMMGGNKEVQDLTIRQCFAEDTPYEIQQRIQKMNNSRDTLQATQDTIRAGADMLAIDSIENPSEIEKIVNEAFKSIGINVHIKLKDNESK